MSTPRAECGPATVEAGLDGLALGEGVCETGKEGVSAKKKRYREKRRRSRKNRDAVASPSATDDVEGSTSKAELEVSDGPPSDTDTVATEPLPEFQYGRALPQPPTPFVQVPVLAHYQLRDIPSAGDEHDKAQRLFATRAIEQGTRIISERPVFTLPAPGDQLPEMMAAYANLPKPVQDRIWDLKPAAPSASEQLHNLQHLTDKLAADLQSIILKPAATRTAEEQHTLAEMAPKLERAMHIWRVAARWHANRSSMTSLPHSQRQDLPRGTPITGLFLARAQLRHSCVPNCFASFDAALGRMNVHATRTIAAGEELTAPACADEMYYQPAAARAVELAAWGLTCVCEACDEQHPRFPMHEAARQRAHTRVILLVDMLARLETEEFSEPVLTDTQNIVLSLLRDLKATGCETVETVRWRNVLVDRVLPARALVVPEGERLLAWRIVLGHARECERVGRVCCGEDREEVGVLRRMREGVEGLVREAEAYEAGE